MVYDWAADRDNVSSVVGLLVVDEAWVGDDQRDGSRPRATGRWQGEHASLVTVQDTQLKVSILTLPTQVHKRTNCPGYVAQSKRSYPANTGTQTYKLSRIRSSK